jgi:hypothetical protein
MEVNMLEESNPTPETFIIYKRGYDTLKFDSVHSSREGAEARLAEIKLVDPYEPWHIAAGHPLDNPGTYKH